MDQQGEAVVLSPGAVSNTSTTVARPKTRNPHRTQDEQDAEYRHEHSGVLSEAETSMGGVTSPNRATGTGATMQANALASGNSFTQSEGEILWSESGADIPTSSLHRPGTSNPRYAAANMTPVRHTSTPPVLVAAASRTATDSPIQQENTNEGPGSGVDCHNISNIRKDADKKSVLWAAEGSEVDPTMIARPLTSNPWLSRVIDSGNLKDALSPSNSIGAGAAGKNVVSGSSAERNGIKEGSQILWSSTDVDDWRLLARPHAANPHYEADRDVHNTPPTGANGEQMSHELTRKVSEILWKRDESADEVVQGQRLRIEELEREVQLLKAQLIHHGLAPATALPMNYTGDRPAEQYQTRNYYINDPPQPQGQQQQKEQQVDSMQMEHPEEQNPAAQAAHSISQQQAEANREAIIAKINHSKQPRPQSAQRVRPGTSNPAAARSLPGGEAEEEDSGLIVEDDTPDDQMDPELLDDQIRGGTPPTTRGAPSSSSGQQQVGAVANYGGSATKPRSFVDKITNEVAQQRPGTAQPSRSGPAADDGASYVVSKMSGQSTTSHTGAGSSTSGAVSLPGSSTLHRPYSAPVQRAIVSGSPSKGAFMSSVGVARAISTTSMAQDENSQMIAEYQNMLQPGQRFVAKADFAECYTKRAHEYGCVVTDRQMERMLMPYRSAGAGWLSVDEFSILFLKLQQW